MNRKNFYTGVATGVVSAVIAFGVLNVASVAISAKTKTEFDG